MSKIIRNGIVYSEPPVYANLPDKPQINGHVLIGNKTGEDLELLSDYGEYTIINGIRVYISATEPTGTIPDGSIWLGGVI